jgi:hypothetical protein
VFFRVVLPQLRLAICGGALLVGLHLLAEYGLYAMIRFDTFTTAIFDQFKSTLTARPPICWRPYWPCAAWRCSPLRPRHVAMRAMRGSVPAAPGSSASCN